MISHVGEGVVKDMNEKGMETLRILVEEPYPVVDHFPSPVDKWADEVLFGNHLLRFPAGEGAGGR